MAEVYLMISERDDEVSDTRDDDQGTEAGNIKLAGDCFVPFWGGTHK
jgi:hypothetical protein